MFWNALQERGHIVARVEADGVGHHGGEDLVVAILEVPLLVRLDGIVELVLVVVDHLATGRQVGPQRHQLAQVQHAGAEEGGVGGTNGDILGEPEGRGAGTPVPLLGWQSD